MHRAIHGRHAEARDCAEKALAISPSSPINIGLLAGVLHNAGETGRAEALLERLPAGSHTVASAVACFHLVRGEIDAAVEWAGKAMGERDPLFIYGVVRPFEKVLRQSPGWPALLKKMNLAEVS